MHIGLIGGIGPAATIVYYQRMVDRWKAAKQVLELTIVHADIDVLVANAFEDRRDDQAAVYVGLINRLRGAGADVAAITSVGGHFCYTELEPISPLPLISAIGPMDDWFARRGIERIGILGTSFVMRTHLYGELTRTASSIPSNVDEVGDAYRAIALAGHCTDEQRALLFAAGREMMDSLGTDAILLGGTDLGLAFDGRDPGFPIVDAVDIHIDALFKKAVS